MLRRHKKNTKSGGAKDHAKTMTSVPRLEIANPPRLALNWWQGRGKNDHLGPSFCPKTISTIDTGRKEHSKMLATSNFGSTSSQPHKFLPSVPSPLSPRRANVKSSSTSFWSPQHASNQQSHVPFSSRPVKAAPVPRSDALRERRRDMFLRKVRQARDENKWDSRIDDVHFPLPPTKT